MHTTTASSNECDIKVVHDLRFENCWLRILTFSLCCNETLKMYKFGADAAMMTEILETWVIHADLQVPERMCLVLTNQSNVWVLRVFRNVHIL